MTPQLLETIGRAQTGDVASLESLAVMIRPAVERQLLRYPISDEDRRDVLQTTLLQVVRRIATFRGESTFSTWLFRVTANEALMLMRSQRRHRKYLAPELDLEELESVSLYAADQGDRLEGGEREAAVQSAVAQLPSHYRDVVTAHYHQDLCLQEIARRLEATESAIRSRLHRARAQLRDILSSTSIASGI
jgi:RNA polymerase sigma-70 factor (ECF subfamily)